MRAAREILKMHPFDARTEFPNPVFRIAVCHHVRRVQISAHPIATDFVHNLPHLLWTEQEFVPDVLKSDSDVMCLGRRRELLQNPNEVIPNLLISPRHGELPGVQ